MKKLTKIVIATLMTSTAITAAPKLKWSGDAQFRLREEWKMTTDTTGEVVDSLTSSAFYNKYAWNLKLDAKINEKFSMKFRVSNPNGAGLETFNGSTKYNQSTEVDINTENNTGSFLDNSKYVAIPPAEMVWKPGKLSLHTGILEVKNNTVLILVSSGENGGYQNGINISNGWDVTQNNSQVGMKVGVDLGMAKINVVGAIADKYSDKNSSGTKIDETDFRWIFDAPISIADGKFKVTPVVSIRSGITGHFDSRTYNTNGGLDFSGKINDLFSFAIGAAYGQYVNNDAKVGDWKKPSGFLLVAKPTVKFGKNKITLGYSFGSSRDLEDKRDVKYTNLYNHFDLKWGISVNKNFTVMPRFRTWINSDNDTSTGGAATIRPELIFVGKF